MRLIDADALITELNGIRYPGAPYVDAGIRIAIGKVCDAPTIEERKTGEWKFYGKETWVRDDGKPVFIQCSECNATVMNNGSAVWNFCPDCGADMRKGEGEKE